MILTFYFLKHIVCTLNIARCFHHHLFKFRLDDNQKSNFNIAIKKVFRQLEKKDKKWKEKKIVARFICALTIFGFKKKPIHSLGIIEGMISKTKKGKNGFGYDPIFIPNGRKQTFGQMKPSIKYKIDH